MKATQLFAATLLILSFVGTSWAHQRGVTEISEGTIRTIYIDRPLVGAKGYVVADWENRQVRVEVKNFPSSSTCPS